FTCSIATSFSTTGATGLGFAVNCPAGASLFANVWCSDSRGAQASTFFTQINTVQSSFGRSINGYTAPARVWGEVVLGTASSHTGTVQVRMLAVGSASTTAATATVQVGAAIRAYKVGNS